MPDPILSNICNQMTFKEVFAMCGDDELSISVTVTKSLFSLIQKSIMFMLDAIRQKYWNVVYYVCRFDTQLWVYKMSLKHKSNVSTST